jgi:hypothetical protein
MCLRASGEYQRRDKADHTPVESSLQRQHHL